MTKTPPFPTINDFNPFLGYGPNDYEVAKKFYQEIGFIKIWDGGEACGFDTLIGHRFLVTLHHGLERSSAGMMHLWVESVDDWYAYLTMLRLDEKYPDVKIAEPVVAVWGWCILYVWDPGGWLLHFAEPHSEENKTFFNHASWLKE